MMGELIQLDIDTTVDLPAEKILDETPRTLAECLVLGWTAEDQLYFSTTTADRAEMLLLLETAKKHLLEDI